MWTEELRVSENVSAAAWIGPRLGGAFGAVTRTVPDCYPAYVRICHPAVDRDGGRATWSRVAQATGRQAHPVMQWHALVGSADPINMDGSLWPGDDPEQGNLEPEVLGPLCDLLASHTATAAHCFFCLWDGWAWIGDPPESAPSVLSARSVEAAPAVPGSDEPIPPAFTPEELRRPRVHLPDRDYLLLAGPLHAAPQIGWWPSADWFSAESPNLFWPADQAWCVASEIDFDSTLVGGTTELIDAILQAPMLDSWPVRPDDSLAADADQVNPVPDIHPVSEKIHPPR